MKQGYYFPHFEEARNDRKIKRLRKELGIEGYGIYFMILEVLRSQPLFKYPINDIDLLADDFGTSEQKVKTVIFSYELFIIESTDFFSTKFIENLEPYLKMVEQRRIAGLKSGETRKIKAIEKLNSCSTAVERSLNENEQSKENKSKENENKKTFFKIGLKEYQIPLSQYIKSNLTIFFETFCINNKVQNPENLLKEVEKQYFTHDFKNENHIKNSIGSVYKKLIDKMPKNEVYKQTKYL